MPTTELLDPVTLEIISYHRQTRQNTLRSSDAGIGVNWVLPIPKLITHSVDFRG